MKLNPKYSYEFNQILNEQYDENELIKNFASLLTDKDRFLPLLLIIENKQKELEEKLGYTIKDELDFFVVRSEKFKSFSEPITIEYSIFPEEMLLFLLKEILKVSITDRFPDEVIREQYINSFIEFFIEDQKLQNFKLEEYTRNLHDESLKLFENYSKKDIDFSTKTMKEYVEELFLNF